MPRPTVRLVPAFAAGLAILAAFVASSPSPAQSTAQPQGTINSPFTPAANGPMRNESSWLALVGATVHPSPGEVLVGATVVIRDGVITSIIAADPGPDRIAGTGDDVPPRTPEGPREVDCRGEHLYAAFIEAYCEVRDVPTRAANATGGNALHDNDEVQPQRSALDGPRPESALTTLRERGFAAVALAPDDGVFRGRAAVVSTAVAPDEPSARKPRVYAENVYHACALEYRDEDRGYPDSLMGSIALARQTLSDAQWMADTRDWVRRNPSAVSVDPGPTNAMDYLAPGSEASGVVPARPASLLFRTDDELDALRAIKVAREFDRPAMIVGSGREYRRMEALVAALKPVSAGHREDEPQMPLIVPLNFPKQPDVSSVAAQEGTDVRTMMEWEQGPTNPRRCIDAGLSIALTSFRLRDGDDFLGAMRTAIAHGLSPSAAHHALTVEPARILGLGETMGTIEAGKRANLLLSDQAIFTSAADPRAIAPTLRAIYIDGVRHEMKATPTDFGGTWRLEMSEGGVPGLGATGLSATGIALRITRSGEVWVEATPTKADDVAKEADKEADKEAAKDAAEDAGAKPEAERAKAPAPKSVRATSVQLSRQAIAFQFDPSKLVERVASGAKARAGVVSMTAAVTLGDDGKPVALIGQGLSDESRRFTFRAVKEAPKSPQGVWRVTEAAGLALATDAPRQVFITLDDAAASIVVMLEPANVPEADGAGVRQANLPRFATLRAEDIAYQDDGCRFTIHADAMKKLTELGFRQAPVDMVVTIRRTGGASALGDAERAEPKEPSEPRPAEDAPADDAEPLRVAFALEAVDHAPTEDSLKKSRAMLRRINAIPFDLPTPFGPYGAVKAADASEPSLVAFTNATIWTQTDRGILENATLVIKEGKVMSILAAGGAIPSGATIIDTKGLHITPGIIDCHSHIGISKGVNEGGQAITAEVRIKDVTNPDDVNWYRHLASGVTVVNSLHGSANCIGGQSQTVKARWGATKPDDMHMQSAPPGIKFALGENPTQVNWGLARRERYPISRMGIAALIRDRFTQTKTYMAARDAADATKPPLRRDLELDALAEVIEGERLIHCHAYRQDEMRMLISTMRDFGVRIATFQHVLEGYKLADEIRDHTGGGSGFTDWWAYKVEVQDAIPQGLPMMQEVGGVVSFNSDSAEMARRLNVEAAKAIKYSDDRISPQEALAFVTNAPAKQLGIDTHVGALAPGMDADLAIWNGSPLSSLSRCVSTWLDGREVFSDARDAALRETIRSERARLIRKIQGVGEDDPDEEPASDQTPTAPTGDPQRPEGAPEATPGKVDGPPTQLAIHRQRHREALRRKYLEAHAAGRLTPDLLPGYCGCD